MDFVTLTAYLIAAAALCIALSAACDPRLADWLASVLAARAEAVRVARKTYKLCRARRLTLEAAEAEAALELRRAEGFDRTVNFGFGDLRP